MFTVTIMFFPEFIKKLSRIQVFLIPTIAVLSMTTLVNSLFHDSTNRKLKIGPKNTRLGYIAIYYQINNSSFSGRRTNKHKKVETTINPIYHFLQNKSPELPNENNFGLVFEKEGNTSTPMRKSSANLKSEGKLEPSSNKISAKTFQCPYCESKFSQNHNLKSHVKQKHQENFNKTDLKTPPINRKRKSIGQSGHVKKSRQISKVQTQSEERIDNLEEVEINDVEPTETQKLPIYVDPIKKPFVTLMQVLGEDDL